MTKTTKKAPTSKSESTTDSTKKRGFSRQQKVIFGTLLVLFSIALTLSFVSFFIYGQQDQSAVHEIENRSIEVRNWLGKFGAYLSNVFVYEGFGVSAFIFARLFFLTGAYLILDLSVRKLRSSWFWDSFLAIIVAIIFGFFATKLPELGGVIGFEMNDYLQDYLGKTGALLVLIFAIIIFLIFRIKVSPDAIKNVFENTKNKVAQDFEALKKTKEETKSYNLEEFAVDEEPELIEKEPIIKPASKFEIDKEILKPTISHSSELNLDPKLKRTIYEPDLEIEENDDEELIFSETSHKEEFVIEKVAEEETIDENTASRLVADFGLFDPTLDLSNYKFPSLDLLKEYSTGGITINQAELEENKNKIVETLRNYKIEIAQIKATVGPSVTLYEIVPEAGIRISKIKSLEDDIALSLSALGIRIIAPIPGKGTIGIEVPNKNPTMVSMKSVIGSARFQEAEMELPIALGKTISNETFVVDLAKMPHLLMAGATGQGKSVGLNAVLTSLLYKKHPAEVKFVLVDPKKVELTLFNKIERHYLAKLPDAGDAIITDNAKVINTLNSLCVEKDNR